MIEMLKQMICLAAGVGLGYYIHYQQAEKNFQEHLDEARFQIEYDLNQEYQRKVSELLKRHEEAMADLDGDKKIAADIPEEPEETAPLTIPEAVNTALVNYGGIPAMPREPLKVYNRPTEVIETLADIPPQTIVDQPVTVTESDFVANEVPPRFKPPKNNPVQIVDETVFENNEDGYSEYTLEYWAENDVMTGETGNVVTDTYRNEILGEEGLALLKAGPEALGGSNLYIRHTGLLSVFEIIWNQGSFIPETEDA